MLQIIVILLIAMLMTLGLGLMALFRNNPKQLNLLLWLRIAIAGAIIMLLIGAAASGKLAMQAPWNTPAVIDTSIQSQ